MKTSRSMFVRGLGAAVTLAAVAFCSLNAQAVPVTALSNPFAGVSTAANIIQASEWLASGFTTGTDPNFLGFSSVSLALATSGTVVSSTPIVSLYSGVSAPSAFVTALSTTGPVTSPSPVSIEFSPSTSPIALSPNTNYWIVASAEAGDAYAWYFTSGAPTGQNSSGWSAVTNNGQKSINGGASYAPDFLTNFSQMEVKVTAVPEPSTVVLAGLGVAGLAIMERGRRQRRKSRTVATETGVDLG